MEPPLVDDDMHCGANKEGSTPKSASRYFHVERIPLLNHPSCCRGTLPPHPNPNHKVLVGCGTGVGVSRQSIFIYIQIIQNGNREVPEREFKRCDIQSHPSRTRLTQGETS